MQLPGRLRVTTLGDVLGALYRERAHGVLELTSRNGASHRIGLRSGLIDGVDSPIGARPLGHLLRDQGLLSAGRGLVLERWLAATPDKWAGELLVEKRLAPAPVVAVALRRQISERLEALYKLDDACLKFHPRRPAQPPAPRPVPLMPPDFLHGRPRARGRPHPDVAVGDTATESPLAALLGLPLDADATSIRRAFRKAAASLHPDRYPGASTSEQRQMAQRFAELSTAYHALIAAA